MAEVVSVEGVESTPEGVVLSCDAGGGPLVSADHYGPSGDDSPPLPGDFASVEDARTGGGHKLVLGYHDPNNASKAANGEVRRYARASSGAVTCEFWLKGNGDVEITSIKTGGVVRINGVEIDQQGNIKTPGKLDADGEVTAQSSSAPVALSTHLHPTGMGPSDKPTPGT